MKIYSIQYLRAYAALAVLLFHGSAICLSNSISKVFSFGQYGVEIFFLISGFIMAHTMSKSPNYKSFFRQRLARIYPMYYLAILFALVLHYLGIGGMNEGEIYDYTLFKYFDTANHRLPVAWTLYFEMFFYLICTFCLLIFGKKYQIGLFIFAISAIFVPNLLAFSKLNSSAFLNFLVGLYFYEVRKNKDLLSIAMVAMCLFKLTSFSLNDIERVAWLSVAMILVLAIDKFKFKEIKSLTLLGDCSYSLYLVHFSLCYLVLKLLPTNPFWNVIVFSFYMVAVVIASIMTHLYIEKPINRFIKKFIDL